MPDAEYERPVCPDLNPVCTENYARLIDRCSHLAMQINALEEVIRGVIIASRPDTPDDEKEWAWKAAGAVMNISEARKDKNFVARLAEVRAKYKGAK